MNIGLGSQTEVFIRISLLISRHINGIYPAALHVISQSTTAACLTGRSS